MKRPRKKRSRNWEYRIVKYVDGGYGLHVVYLAGDGEVLGFSTDPCTFEDAHDPAEIMVALQEALDAAQDEPVFHEPRWA